MKKRGFSVAEALTTLLITSVALGILVPIYTKRQSTTQSAMKNISSKWSMTKNNKDITRNSKVGINVPTTSNPKAKLEIINNSNDNSILITRNNRSILTIQPNGSIVINNVNNNNGVDDVIQIQNNGVRTGWIKADGSSSFGSGGSIGMCMPDYEKGYEIETKDRPQKTITQKDTWAKNKTRSLSTYTAKEKGWIRVYTEDGNWSGRIVYINGRMAGFVLSEYYANIFPVDIGDEVSFLYIADVVFFPCKKGVGAGAEAEAEAEAED